MTTPPRIVPLMFLTITPMRVVCAWCQVELRAGTGPVSHGICAACEQAIDPRD